MAASSRAAQLSARRLDRAAARVSGRLVALPETAPADASADSSAVHNNTADANPASLLALLLSASTAPAPSLPVQPHDRRLSSGDRGLSLAALRALRDFYAAHGGLSKVMGAVCKEEGYGASVCALTRSTGLSLAESLVLTAQAGGAEAAALIGHATTFFSYSWTGTTLGDMLATLERKLVQLEAMDGQKRYVWVDMFAASQNLLAGAYLPPTSEGRDAPQGVGPHRVPGPQGGHRPHL